MSKLETKTVKAKIENEFLQLKEKITEDEIVYLSYKLGEALQNLADLTGKPIILEIIETTTIFPQKEKE